MAVQRYIFVCHSSVAKTWCTVTKSKLLVVLVVSLAVLHMAGRMVDRDYMVEQQGQYLLSPFVLY